MNQLLVQIDASGRLVLPKEIRTSGHKYYACQTEKDGTVHLVPVTGFLTSKQAYFWTPQWQAGETEVNKELSKGKGKKVSYKKLATYLKDL